MKHLLSFKNQPDWLKDGLIILALWAGCLMYLAPAFAPGEVLLPLDIIVEGMPPWQKSGQVVDLHNPILEDAVYYIFPVKQWTAAVVGQGDLPLWNPYVFTGYPAIYDTQAGLFYPFSLLYYTLPSATAVDLTILLQMMAGISFMYLYLRQIRLRRAAAVVGSVLFVGNGLMVVWLEWQVVQAAIIWLPLVLYFVERAVKAEAQGGSPLANAAAAGVALAMPWLGGHWNWSLYISMTVGVYLLWRLWSLWRRQAKAALSILGVTLGAGIGLSLVQVLPAFRFLSQSHRQPLTWAEVKQFGLLNRFVVVTVPDFFGSPQTGTWWGIDNYNETTFYVGIAALLLAGLAVWLRRDQMTKFWAVWGGLGLLLLLGAPFYGVLYILPVFNGLLPSRAAVLVVVATAVLAALGTDALLKPSFRPRTGWVLVGSAGLWVGITAVYLFVYRDSLSWSALGPALLTFLLFLGAGGAVIGLRLAGKLPAAWFAAALLALIAADLFIFGHDYNTVSPVADLYPPTATDRFLQEQPGPVRIVTQAEGVAYRPNTALVPRVANLSGYGPGIPARLTAYMRLAEGSDAVRFNRVLLPLVGVDSPLLDALGVGYLVTIADVWGETAVPAGQAPQDGWGALTRSPRQAPLPVGAAGLQRVDVALRLPEAAAGRVMMRIFTADGGQELAHAELPAADIKQTGWTPFYFSVFPPEWGDEFRLELTYAGEGEMAVGETAVGDIAYVSYVLPRPQIVHQAEKTRVYARENALSRAYAVSAALPAQNETEALALLAENADKLDKLVVVEADTLPYSTTNGAAAEHAGEVTIIDYDLNEVTIAARMTQPGYVVLADLFYPGWRATVDGEPVPIYRANSISRAVAVPVGVHDIQFTYRPLEFYAGALVSGLVLLTVLALWGWTWWGTRGR